MMAAQPSSSTKSGGIMSAVGRVQGDEPKSIRQLLDLILKRPPAEPSSSPQAAPSQATSPRPPSPKAASQSMRPKSKLSEDRVKEVNSQEEKYKTSRKKKDMERRAEEKMKEDNNIIKALLEKNKEQI